MIGSRCIHGWIYTRKIRDSRMTKYVKKKQRRRRKKEVILHRRFMLRFPFILIIKDNVGWLFNTNSVDSLIVVHNKCGVWNGRTQDNIIWRIITMRG